MTMISAFATHGVLTLMGDLLASRPAGPDRADLRLPFGYSRDIHPDLTFRWMQKIVKVNDYLAVAWSGPSAVAAATVVDRLRASLRNEVVPSDLLRTQIMQIASDPAVNQIHLLCMYLDNDMYTWLQVFQVSQVDDPYEKQAAFCAGTGQDDFQRNLQTVRLRGGPREPWEAAIARAHGIYGMFLSSELHGSRSSTDEGKTVYHSLVKQFGGGYEVAIAAAGQIRKVGNTLLVFWDACIDGDGEIQLGRPVLLLKREYRKNRLVLRWAPFLNWTGNVASSPIPNQDCVEVLEPREALEALRVGKGPSLDREEWASFEHRLEGHVVLLRRQTGEPWLVPGPFAQPSKRSRTRLSVH